MPILFASNSLQDFVANTEGVYRGPSDPPAFGSKSAMLENIHINLYSNTIGFSLGKSVSEIYFSEYVYSGAPVSTGTPTPIVLTNGGVNILYVKARDGGFRIEVFNGTTFVDVTGLLPAAFIQSNRRMDWYIKLHATEGRIRCKYNGLTVIDYTGPIAPATMTFDGMRIGSWSAGSSYHGEVIASTENTEGLRVVTLNYITDGSNTEWTGGVSNVNWLPTGTSTYTSTYPDDTFITPSATEQTETFNPRDIPAAFAEGIVKAVVIGARGNIGDGVGGINGVVRVGGTNYEKAPQKAPVALTGPFQTVFETNPATGLPWTISEVNGAEFGYRSKA